MKEIQINKWCYSSDGEYFYSEEYGTKEEAITECLADYGDGYVGRIVMVEFTEEDISYDETGYYLRKVLYDKVGDVAGYWEMTDEQELELSEILAKEVIRYINEHKLQPSCCKVINIEAVK